jgi:hypothetical protein
MRHKNEKPTDAEIQAELNALREREAAFIAEHRYCVDAAVEYVAEWIAAAQRSTSVGVNVPAFAIRDRDFMPSAVDQVLRAYLLSRRDFADWLRESVANVRTGERGITALSTAERDAELERLRVAIRVREAELERRRLERTRDETEAALAQLGDAA